MNLRDRVAVVTGGSSGMGWGAAAGLADAGCRVAILARSAERASERAEKIGAIAVRCDVADASSVEAAFEQVERTLGVASVLVHAAADGSTATLLDADGRAGSLETLQQIVQTNLVGTLLVAREMSSRMVRGNASGRVATGLIVNVSSIGAADGVVGAAYAASKGGVDALTLSLARELSPWCIRVVTIAPGAIDTEMLRSGATPETWAVIAGQALSTRRAGTPAEFAALVRHLAENDYLNGCVIRFDSGMRIPYSFGLGGGMQSPGEAS
ncbi:SDR family NAD(P)-dependent oxidoreductase [Sinimarinibacterium flocculans]|uniref:SDR family NAD(P)-dependent oxidoreductase n=1 Tax=Sinimarinibacterium flocculans TaxID=985250 RepID=UPI0024909018|nr:SDR family NAD(P)-dependent oxidoreductase [Sinimarinibacterium flocculans]